MADLKPCPFHGKHPDNCRCLHVLLPHSFNDSVSRWDCRPLEDAKDATLAEIRAILAEPVRHVIGGFPRPDKHRTLWMHEDQWRRLHELLGGDHAAHANREGK